MYDLHIPISSVSEFSNDTYQVEKDKEVILKLFHDSRRFKNTNEFNKNLWFICLKGEKHDGHQFVEELIQKGVNRFIYEKARIRISVPGLQVNDTNLFLTKLASFWRIKHNPLVMAITGSNGKTSTKEVLSFLLSNIFGHDHVFKK